MYREYHTLFGVRVMEEGSVYKIIDLVGTSTKSWEDAVANVVAKAAKNLRDLRIAEVDELDVKIEDGKIVAYRARVKLSFKYEKE
jgi:flavin-binding protein dodecin